MRRLFIFTLNAADRRSAVTDLLLTRVFIDSTITVMDLVFVFFRSDVLLANQIFVSSESCKV